MSTKTKPKKNLESKRRHPKGMKLSEALAEDAPRLKALKGLHDKKATLIKTSDDDAINAELAVAEGMRPTDEQVARINAFTRSPKTADELAVFPTLSCNDLVDRDDDKFSTQCVKDFASLEQPFSPIGKSFMLDHNYSTGSQIGRIFGAETKKVSGVQWLKNEVYVPNTEANKAYLESVDFGIHWAVSVGVVLGSTECTVCQAPFGSYGYWCANGHDKGLYYDPKSDETDSWGYPAPCDPETSGAILCVRQFDDPRDMYELSQVFLGAQYFAALDKDPEFRSMMKAAGANVPILGLSGEEAAKLPLHHEPLKVSEARLKFALETADDGSINWTDEHDNRWSFDPENPSDGVMSLGKASNDDDNEENDSGAEPGQEGEGGLHGQEQSAGSEPSGGDPEGDGPGDEGSGSGQGLEGDQSAADGEQQGGEPGTVTADADDEDDEESEDEEDESEEDESNDSDDADDEDKSVSRESVLAAARKAKLSDSCIEAVSKATGNGLDALLHVLAVESKASAAKIAALTPKAALGEQYVSELRASAINEYVKARQTKDSPKVKTETFERKLDHFGDDVELLKAEIEEQHTLAQERFPKAVRRSSFPDDPNTVEDKGESEIHDEDGTFGPRIRNIHG